MTEGSRRIGGSAGWLIRLNMAAMAGFSVTARDASGKSAAVFLKPMFLEQLAGFVHVLAHSKDCKNPATENQERHTHHEKNTHGKCRRSLVMHSVLAGGTR